jgi:putative transposase
VLLRLAYLGLTSVFALLRLLPMSSQEKDAEILALRHQLLVLQRQLGPDRVRFTRADRTLLAALLHGLSRDVLKRLRLVVSPDTVLRWHRDMLARRHAQRSRPARPGRPRTVRSIRVLVLRLVRENPGWGYRRVHGELLVLGVKVAASTVWEILHEAGIDPAPERSSATWAGFLRSQAEALLACDFVETVTLSGARLHVLAVIEHASRRIRILGATAHPTAPWVAQAARNLVMDLEDAGCRARYLIRDRDGKFPALFDTILADAGIETVLSGVRMPRMKPRVAYCTSSERFVARWCSCRSDGVVPASLVAGWRVGSGRVVEDLAFVVIPLPADNSGVVPDLDGAWGHAEQFGYLAERDQPGVEQPLAAAA